MVQSTPIEAAVTLPPPAQILTPQATPTATPADAPTSLPDPVRHAPEAERRQVTVLFCDLVDSTQLSQHLDAEDYRAVVRAYQEAAVTAMQPWDGYVAQYLGDGLLVYFGWPTAHEDAAVRAVHASLALLAALEPFNTTQLEPRYGVRVQVRLGVHTGMAVIGAMGGGDRREQLAMGDTPNIAARLQMAIPTTLQDSLMARLDRLPMIREVAQLGAVLGREFAYEMLRALAGVEDALLQDRLAQLVDTELLYQRGRPPRATYSFKHALVQDAAYASLLKSTRQQYHQ